MAQDYARKFYNSKAWKKCRESFISDRIDADGGLCQRCREYTGYIVHHKKMLTPENINDAMVTLNHENLEYLCLRCHNDEHTADMFGVDYVFINGAPSPRQKSE